MMNGWTRGRLSRVSHALLLIVLALGIAGMHTLGHPRHGPAHQGGPMIAGPAPAAGHRYAATHPVAQIRAEAPLWIPAPESVSGSKGGFPPLDPASICLAVLTGVLILLLAAAVASARRFPRASTTAAASAPRVARPPPRRTASRLACLSVLRI